MMRFSAHSRITSAIVTAFSLLLPAARAVSAAPDSDTKDLLTWRAERAKTLSSSDGWLTLVGLEWLKTGKNSIGTAADNQIRLHGHAPQHLAIIEVEGSQLKLLPPEGGFSKFLFVNSKPAQEQPLQADDGKPSLLTTENLSLMILRRGDRFALRIKDAESPTRTRFRGLHWYPPDPRYRITAKWIPFVPAHTEKIPTIIGTTLDMPAPGIAEFALPGDASGKTIQLEPVLETPSAKELFFIIRDATSRTTTYESARFLYADLPDHGLDKPGTIVLDFNRLQNPPCAYTPYATCPLPPYGNRLAVSIPAGEQRYTQQKEGAGTRE